MRIKAKPLRSVLFVPGNKEDWMRKAPQYGPDALILDLEDSVPDSSNTCALGFSMESGVRYEIGLIRNHYVGRTFIEPTQQIRSLGVKLK